MAEDTEIDSAASLSGMSQHSCSPTGKAADVPVCWVPSKMIAHVPPTAPPSTVMSQISWMPSVINCFERSNPIEIFQFFKFRKR